MTGIERLRELAREQEERSWSSVGKVRGRMMLDIADQIEREHDENCHRMDLDYGAVWRVVTDMERHVSGVEGMEDSPVARWARELREALGGNGRDPSADVSMSAYDLLPQEDREAIAWVRDHGGLDAVKRRWECLSYYADPVPRSCMEKRLARLQRQIDESHAALRRRNQRIAVLASEINRAHNENYNELMRRAGNYTDFADEVCKRLAPKLRCVEGCTKDVMDAALDALDRRLMPEGCEWPRYEDGKLVNLGDRYECWCGKTHVVSSVSVRKGCSVLNASDESHTFVVSDGPLTSHGKRVKRPAVPAADGEPLEVGQTVWDANGDELVVVALEDGGHTVTCRYADVGDSIPVHGMWSPSDLTHERPVADTWERLEEDAEKDPCSYFGIDGKEPCGKCPASGENCEQTIARDIVRRARALAGDA